MCLNRIGSPFRLLNVYHPFKFLKHTFEVSIVLNIFVSVRSLVLSLLLRTRYSVRRWRTSNRKRMPLNGSFGIPPWVDWGGDLGWIRSHHRDAPCVNATLGLWL
jgi:hypothetical protein